MKPCSHDSRPKYELLIEPLREEARRLGYTICVHGTLVRDIDLVACPWTSQAVSARELAEALGAVIDRVNGVAFQHEGERGEYFLRGQPGSKPHGRLCWNWHLGGGPYIDLSVMPRTDPQSLDGQLVKCSPESRGPAICMESDWRPV